MLNAKRQESQGLAPAYVEAPVNYLADLSVTPVTYNPPAGTGIPKRVGNYRDFTVKVADGRPSAAEIVLASHGLSTLAVAAEHVGHHVAYATGITASVVIVRAKPRPLLSFVVHLPAFLIEVTEQARFVEGVEHPNHGHDVGSVG